jgi:two-component system, LytTR family, sensor kinase
MDEATLNARKLSSLSTALPGKGLFAPWFTVFAVSSLIGLFFAAQMHYSGAAFGRPVSWGQALYWGLGDWYEWAILSPIIFWLGHRFTFERRRWRRSFAIHFSAAVIVSVAHLLLCGLTEQLQAWFEGNHVSFAASFQRLFINRFHFNMAVYGLILCAINAWAYYRQYREREAQAAELAGRLAQAQLQALRSQLNPHFLFNTLHAVSSLMLKDVYAANRMLTRLGELLRLSLDTTDQQEVPLRQELEFLRRYIEIEEIRFGDRLAVQMSIEPGTLDAVVPNLLLQPLVENAIRYAVEPNLGPGQVQLSSVRSNGQLILQVSDNGIGPGSGEPHESDSPVVPREGIGLSNTRQRLQQLYGEKQSLALKRRVSGGLLVSISIPFYTKAEPDAHRWLTNS